MNKKVLKKTPEELEEYLKFKRHGFAVPAKKGRGSKYSRKRNKRKEIEDASMV